MDSWRRRGRDENSAPDPHSDATTPGADATEETWAPAATGGGVVSLDEDQFTALIRPLRETRRPLPPSADCSASERSPRT